MHDPARIDELEAAILAHLGAQPGDQATTSEVAEGWLPPGKQRIGQDLVWIALARLEARQVVRRATFAGRIVWSETRQN